MFNNPQQNVDFSWIVAVFKGSGAVDAMKIANNVPLKTYFPIKFDAKGVPLPLWRNYLFIEFRENLTAQICRSTNKFIKVLSMRDKEGTLRPVLVRKTAIDESLGLIIMGKFNERSHYRRFYGKGSIVRVIEGPLIDKRVRLAMDIEPKLPGNRKVLIDINGCRGSIELWKLAL
jgi:hypothetical protein